MILKLTTITKEEIKLDAQKAANEMATQIMYLHNNGMNNAQWDKHDFLGVLGDDLED